MGFEPGRRHRGDPGHAQVVGAGIAGLTLSRLLTAGGWNTELVGTAPASPRWVTLANATRQLIEKIWGHDIVFEVPHHELAGRRVIWGRDDAKGFVAEPMLAIEATSLAAAMRRRMEAQGLAFASNAADAPSARVMRFDARGRAASGARRGAGLRRLRVWPPMSIHSHDTRCCEVYAGDGYWAFTLPISPGLVSLQIATPDGYTHGQLRSLLAAKPPHSDSLLGIAIRTNPDQFDLQSASIEIAPALNEHMASAQSLAVGDAAMTLDPLCGDGIGHGIKSALLATAVANSVNLTVPFEAAMAHYVSRTTWAFLVHLSHCGAYYASIRYPGPWTGEVESGDSLRHELGAKLQPSDLQLVVEHDPSAVVVGVNRARAVAGPSVYLRRLEPEGRTGLR